MPEHSMENVPINIHLFIFIYYHFCHIVLMFSFTCGTIFAEGSIIRTNDPGRLQTTKVPQMIMTVLFISDSCFLLRLLLSVLCLSRKSFPLFVSSYKEMSSSETLLEDGTDKELLNIDWLIPPSFGAKKNIYLEKQNKFPFLLFSKKEVSILLTPLSVLTLVLLFVDDELTITLILDFLYFLKIIT